VGFWLPFFQLSTQLLNQAGTQRGGYRLDGGWTGLASPHTHMHAGRPFDSGSGHCLYKPFSLRFKFTSFSNCAQVSFDFVRARESVQPLECRSARPQAGTEVGRYRLDSGWTVLASRREKETQYTGPRVLHLQHAPTNFTEKRLEMC
jgi:hypothetical protein